MEPKFEIRSMTRTELNLAVDWAAKEGWNPGLYDADSFYQTDPQGFLIACLNDEPIGTISAVTYNDNFGFIGFYIVKPEFRGQGWGFKLWQAALNYLGNQRNIALDGVIAQQENYQKSGFKIAYRHIRYQGIGGGTMPDQVINLSDVPWEDLLAYDTQHFPAPRPVFLQSWIQQPESFALAIQQQNQLKGYGMIRLCRQGYKIGPLFADDPTLAELLLNGLMAKVPAVPVFLDIPDINPAAKELVQKYSMQPVFETARMYTHQPPNLPLNQIFGVTTLELG